MKKINQITFRDCVLLDKFAESLNEYTDLSKIEVVNKATVSEIDKIVGIIERFDNPGDFYVSTWESAEFIELEELARIVLRVMRSVNSVFVMKKSTKNEELNKVVYNGILNTNESECNEYNIPFFPFDTWKGVHVDFSVGFGSKLDRSTVNNINKLSTYRELFHKQTKRKVLTDKSTELTLDLSSGWNVQVERSDMDWDEFFSSMGDKTKNVFTSEINLQKGVDIAYSTNQTQEFLVDEGYVVFSRNNRVVNIDLFREKYNLLIVLTDEIENILLNNGYTKADINQYRFENLYNIIKKVSRYSNDKNVKVVLGLMDDYFEVKNWIEELGQPVRVTEKPEIVGISRDFWKSK